MSNLGRFKLIAQRATWHDGVRWRQTFWKECPICGLQQHVELDEPRKCAGCTDGEEIWAEIDDEDCLVIGVGKYDGRFRMKINGDEHGPVERLR